MTKLTKPQRERLQRLADAGGYLHVYNGTALRVYERLRDKGYCKLSSAFGPGQGGTSVRLTKKLAAQQTDKL